MSNERRIVVDPVTRIEGHLRVQALLGEDNRIADSMSTGTMWRGLEVILKGRDPRDAWAFVERICGVCTGIHALAAVRSVEDAIGIKIPKNANIIRNLMNATLYVHDHIVHFYQLSALDWVDVVSALDADPRETADLQQKISPKHPLASVGYFRDVQNRLKKFVASGQLGIFNKGYWGHPEMKLPPAVNLLAVTHYLEVLDFQKEIVRIHTILGGKNPHPNYLVGGVACPINVHDTGAQGTMVNEVTLNYMRDIAKRSLEMVENVYLPDIKAIASFYPEWFKVGGGLSGKNVLCYGDFPEVANDWSDASLQLPRGAIIDGKLDEVHDVDLRDLEQIQEYVDHSWYKYPDAAKGLHPWEGVTDQAFELPPGSDGTKTKFKWLSADGKYSWIKSPRWKGHMMEVGPLARLVMGVAKNVPHIKEPALGLLQELNLPLEAVFSTLGRHAARALECRWAAQKMVQYVDDLTANIKAGDEAAANMEFWEPKTWPKECRGVGFCEAPRGALGHWCVIKDTRIANWQAIVPTTWNASPRSPEGALGAFESSLIGTPVADPERPLEIIRTIHSFDPCLACATHLYNPEGEELCRVRVR
ncbi:nickel-dependent hydrogenase large subunit [Sutterella megalosphaeroides]|uniref:Uptake hydrogenase large subunit n=1 Tax=Sutterella megalosphaeroides TaxID=2494234 RepID=A0A2Z6IAR7_9BURK|nr:nickel-dependent hydrogenase large subunit [Sutterella megalosphaeroides]BBF23611.1 uptake hydrogenase large subunit [Sutterella megalosphaeroides]